MLTISTVTNKRHLSCRERIKLLRAPSPLVVSIFSTVDIRPMHSLRSRYAALTLSPVGGAPMFYSNSCSVTPQSKRRNGTLGADRSSKMRSTISSKYRWQVGRDNPVYHLGDEVRPGPTKSPIYSIFPKFCSCANHRMLSECAYYPKNNSPGTTKLYDRRGYNPEKLASFFATY
jgi:hypothetical protein